MRRPYPTDSGGAGKGGKRPRQRRDVSVLPDGAGPASETTRYTRGTGVLKPPKVPPARNLADLGWARRAPTSVGNSWTVSDRPVGRPRRRTAA